MRTGRSALCNADRRAAAAARERPRLKRCSSCACFAVSRFATVQSVRQGKTKITVSMQAGVRERKRTRLPLLVTFLTLRKATLRSNNQIDRVSDK